jgi:hypothetical protein
MLEFIQFEVSLHVSKIGVCVSAGKIIALIFFEDTINSERNIEQMPSS